MIDVYLKTQAHFYLQCTDAGAADKPETESAGLTHLLVSSLFVVHPYTQYTGTREKERKRERKTIHSWNLNLFLMRER